MMMTTMIVLQRWRHCNHHGRQLHLNRRGNLQVGPLDNPQVSQLVNPQLSQLVNLPLNLQASHLVSLHHNLLDNLVVNQPLNLLVNLPASLVLGRLQGQQLVDRQVHLHQHLHSILPHPTLLPLASGNRSVLLLDLQPCQLTI